MSGGSEYTEEDKKRTYRELTSFLSTHVEQNQAAAEELARKYKEWLKTRDQTIKLIRKTAEAIKTLNDETTPIQVVCNGVSAVAKAAMFLGPVAAVAGAGTSIVADVCYSSVSAAKVREIEAMGATVRAALENDREKTADVFDLLNRIRRTTEAIQNCSKKFHSGTLMGFFDNVPSLRRFVRAVKRISDVGNAKSLANFLLAVRDEAEDLACNEALLPSLYALLTYNPGLLELTIKVPEILLNVGIIQLNSLKAGVAGSIARGLNIFAIATDVTDIVSKLSNYGEYPKLSKELLEIEKKLKEEKEQISEVVKNM